MQDSTRNIDHITDAIIKDDMTAFKKWVPYLQKIITLKTSDNLDAQIKILSLLVCKERAEMIQILLNAVKIDTRLFVIFLPKLNVLIDVATKYPLRVTSEAVKKMLATLENSQQKMDQQKKLDPDEILVKLSHKPDSHGLSKEQISESCQADELEEYLATIYALYYTNISTISSPPQNLLRYCIYINNATLFEQYFKDIPHNNSSYFNFSTERAIRYHQSECLQVIFKYVPTPMDRIVINNNSMCAIRLYASMCGFSQGVQLLEEMIHQLTPTDHLKEAMLKNNLYEVQKAEQRGANLNQIITENPNWFFTLTKEHQCWLNYQSTPNGNTQLHIAVIQNNPTQLARLIIEKANPLIENFEGKIPLQCLNAENDPAMRPMLMKYTKEHLDKVNSVVDNHVFLDGSSSQVAKLINELPAILDKHAEKVTQPLIARIQKLQQALDSATQKLTVVQSQNKRLENEWAQRTQAQETHQHEQSAQARPQKMVKLSKGNSDN